MDFIASALGNTLTGWGACALLIGFVLWLLLTDRLQARNRARELSNMWEKSSQKWEDATHTKDTQLTMALEQLRVVATFFSEVDVRQIEDIERTAEAKRKNS